MTIPVIAAIGDSITYGSFLPTPYEAYPYLVGQGLRLRVTDLAVPSTDSEYALTFEVPQLAPNLRVVIINEGTNDEWPFDDAADWNPPTGDAPVTWTYAQHVATYEQLVATVRAQEPRAEIILVGLRDIGRDPIAIMPNASRVKARQFTWVWNGMVRQVANRYGARYVDLWDDTRLYDTMSTYDGVHPTPLGDRFIASDVL